jgi:hypothetical protein
MAMGEIYIQWKLLEYSYLMFSGSKKVIDRIYACRPWKRLDSLGGILCTGIFGTLEC